MNAIPSAHVFPDSDVLQPRFREAGDVTLDRLHRDGRVEDCWLGLHPREFTLLWRLAERPGERMTPEQLLGEVWRIHCAPEANSVALYLIGVRAKLEARGVAGLIGTCRDGGYFLHVPPSSGLSRPGGASAD